LGGSSAINFMGYFRAPDRDIDDLEKLGNPGWNFKRYEKVLQRIEGFVEPEADIKKRFDLNCDNWTIGRDGPLKISLPTKIDNANEQIMQAFHKDGFPVNQNPFNGNPNGYALWPSTRDPVTNKRSYATTAFYLPNKDRKNLTVLVTATVHRILSSTDSNGELTATGVEFEFGGQIRQVFARTDVVISAGTLTSPHLLEQSGIGKRSLLEKLGIPVKLDLPSVGENLQEHVFIGMSYELTDDAQFDTVDLLRDPAVLAEHIELEKQGKGVFHAGLGGVGFLTLDQLTPRAEELYKSMEDMVASLDPKTTQPGLLDQYNLLLERYKPGNGSPGLQFIAFPGFFSFPKFPAPGKRYVTMMLTMNHGFSRGTVHSVSNNPTEAPEIDPGYLSQGIDLEILVELFKRMRRLVQIEPLKDIIAGELNPGAEVQTDQQIVDWIKATFATIYHTIGSCSMLPKDKGGVVDPSLKVYGTKNLRVADISVVPLHVSGNTQSAAYAIGEIAAEILTGKF